jgi:hypothetical protein
LVRKLPPDLVLSDGYVCYDALVCYDAIVANANRCDALVANENRCDAKDRQVEFRQAHSELGGQCSHSGFGADVCDAFVADRSN